MNDASRTQREPHGTASKPQRLSIVLRTYPHTAPLKSGALADPAVELDFNDIEPVHRAFAPMAREQKFDVSELAIVTYLQAKAYGKPVVLLPFVVAARFQQGCLIHDARKGPLDVGGLAGKRIGVRSWSQTTGMWVRAILAQSYGVPIEQIDWVTFEGAHLDEYREPAYVRRAAAEQKLLPMLKSGELDAVILGSDLPDEPGLEPVIDDPVGADRVWYAQHRYVPINHVVVVTRELIETNPDAVRAVYGLLLRGKQAAAAHHAGKPDKLICGFEALRGPLDETLAYCEQQNLLPRRLTTEEIFSDSLSVLGDMAR